MSATAESTTRSGFPVLDMMLQMQRIGMRAMTLYQPIVSAFVESAKSSQSTEVWTTRAQATDARDTNEDQVIGVGEEVLNVGTRMVPGKTTRVRRIVEQTPVRQDVTLHTETVVLGRRRPFPQPGAMC